MNITLDSSSAVSVVFFVEQSSREGSPIQNNTSVILNTTEISGAMEKEVITISSVASPEPGIVTLDFESNDPTIPYGFGSQQPTVPLSLNDLNLPPNAFNVLATMVVIRADDAYSPQSPEPSIPSPISTPPMTVCTIEDWGDTTHTTTDDAIFCTSDEPRRVYWDISSSDTFDSNESRNVSVASSPSSTPPPPRRQKMKLSIEMSFPKKGRVSQHTCEACGQPLSPEKTP